jgi:glutaredoxin-like protein DUF836
MRAVVDEVRHEFGASVVEKDVRDDPETERRYALEIPVLFLGDREVARHRVSASELRRRLVALGL